MDAIRVSKVPGVTLQKAGKSFLGALHLTAHHLIFSFEDASAPEMWASLLHSYIPYPIINLVTRLPQNLRGECPVNFRCRTFETFALNFGNEGMAIDVFESVKELTVAADVKQLYAFFYTPNPPLTHNDGWLIFNPREEFGRMGVGTRSKAWRFTDINKDYTFCPTYPARMVVPTRISDATLQYAVKYRSKGRIPALTYLHWANYGSITRSSQPLVGLTNARSVQDEKLVEAVFQSHLSPESRAGATAPPAAIYGATPTNLIIDARPTTNAMANTAKGAGTENMDYYKECRKAYLGIDNIHTMRDSLNKVVEALRETEILASSMTGGASMLPVDRQTLRRSGWLKHLASIVEGTLVIVRNVHVNSSHVLIHCSDGWDRTSQLSALSQICLDPYYRTLRGFQVLVEKDWLAFGHRFLDRCGHLSSDKFFLAPTEGTTDGAGGGAGAFFASVQNRFVGNHHIKETSPVFHQFLESVRNVQRQFPERFEFNESFLRELYFHLYSCQFGTFLLNSEKERREMQPPLSERTVAVWDFLNSRRDTYINADFKPELDAADRREAGADQGVLLPDPKDLRFWNELYGRGDEEMNGRFVQAQVQAHSELSGPIESAEEDPAIPSMGAGDSGRSPVTALASLPVASGTGVDSTRVSGSMLELGSPPRRDIALPISRSQTLSPSRSSAPYPAPSPRNAPAADLFSSAGLGARSVWGRLSSNATSAFTSLQGAYDGLAKDLRVMNVAPPSPDRAADSVPATPGGGELRGRDELGAWGSGAERFETPRVEEAVRPSTFSASSSFGGNPWATTKEPTSSLSQKASGHQPRLPSGLFDDPWGSVKPATSRPSAASPWERMNDGALPADPSVTVVQPTPRRAASTTVPEPPRTDVTPSAPQPTDADLDPLGVWKT
ncbi:phosphatases II [Peniophora sp. CONT]|nr:phosphatases II [Peniophora sp. CONT]